MPHFNAEKVTSADLPTELYPLMKAGNYRCSVESIYEREAKETGADLVEIVLNVEEEKHKDRKLWKYFPLEPDTDFGLRILKLFAHSLGLDADDDKSYNTDLWLGRELIVKVGVEDHEEYGKRNVPQWFYPIPEEKKDN